MNAEGTLTKAEELAQFGKGPSGRKFTDIEGLDPDTELSVGDALRVLAYAEPDFLDRLWDPPQENAEEHADEVAQVFRDHGIVVAMIKVQGVTVADTGIDHREAYCYDLEVLGFTDPPRADNIEQANTLRSVAIVAAAIALALGAGAALVLTVKLSPQQIEDTVKKAADKTAETAMWLAFAAAAIAAAIIYSKAKG